MTVNTDNKREPQWLALHFSPSVEDEYLPRLAAWCYQYSSQVCIAPQHNGLLLEVAASQSLFGSAEVLTQRIRTELNELGYQPDPGIAPTPEAAHLAARHGLHIRACLCQQPRYRLYKRPACAPLRKFSGYRARHWQDGWGRR